MAYNTWPATGAAEVSDSDHILDLIDAAVDAAAGLPCACGCGVLIYPSGKSLYFAGPLCQDRWTAQLADDPNGVLTRDDAAPVYEEEDDLPVPLRDDGPASVELVDASTVETAPREDLYGTAYRRHCERCAQRVIPRIIPDNLMTELMAYGESRPIRTVYPALRNVCPVCADELPGPVYIATVELDGDHPWLVLELGDGRVRVQRLLTIRELTRVLPEIRDQVVSRTWSQMERQLARFALAWDGASTRTPGAHR